MAAEAFYFLLDQKVTKNQVNKEASLRTGPLPGKTNKTTGCIILPPSLQPTARGKRRYALPTRSPTCFISFHPKLFC
jgi:hypothetical protein